SLDEIATQVAGINERIIGIADTAQAQSTSLQEVNASVTQIDRITQQNVAMVEENTAVTHRLATDVSTLSMQVGQFQVASRSASQRTKNPTNVSGTVVPIFGSSRRRS